MSERQQPGPLVILFGVIGLLVFTALALMLAVVIAKGFAGLLGFEGQIGGKAITAVTMVVMAPVLVLWKKFFTWCGVSLPGKGESR